MRLILHIGMPKCGSSALQTFLSSRGFASLTSHKIGYAAIHANGTVLSGNKLLHRAAQNIHGYCASLPAKFLSGLNEKESEKARKDLKKLGRRYGALVLSSEDWGISPQHLKNSPIFKDPFFEVHAVAWIRPQPEWINSAWWQWGAWSGHPFKRWLQWQLKRGFWGSALNDWLSIKWVKELHVRPLTGDIVSDFMTGLSFPPVSGAISNQSLSGDLLRFFQRHPELRPSPHSSGIEFALSRNMPMDGARAPWILSQPDIQSILDTYNGDNELLKSLLDREKRDLMSKESGWFNATYYSGRPVSDPERAEIPQSSIEEMLVQALKAIERMDESLRSQRSVD